ncbi:MAG TPA: helix-turn-helix transcriptional regulator [Pseudonocardiaceae bacterium]|jgi:transcriptional regulator with XRE-family HTH domain|nr:helix-turn-helix transcriptional regulator [Pseudonocardiaceae bacterium]
MAAKRHRLAQRRRTVGFTQEELAEQLGVDSTTVRRWESGETETGPQPWIRPKLARYLQVSVEELEELLYEPGTDSPSEDPQEVGSDVSGADRVAPGTLGPQQLDQLRHVLHDLFTGSAALGTEAQSRDAAPTKAYAEAQELRGDTGASSSQSGHGLVLPTGHEVLESLVSAVGAELAGSLAGPLLFLGFLSTPTQATPSIEWRAQLREQLRTFLHEWANTMERREHLRMLGWVAASVAASPVLNLDSEEQERLSKVIAQPSRVDDKSIDHIETILQDFKRQEDTFGPHAVLYSVIAQREFVDSLLDECPEELHPRLLSVYSSMSTSIGAYLFNLDDVASAMHYCDQARAAAQKARNTELAIHALCTMSFFASWQGKAHAAIDFAAAARNLGTQTDDHLLRARTAAEFSLAYAVDGQYKECMTEFDRALASFALSAGQRSPESPVYWLHEGLVASHQSDGLLRLGKPAEAAISAERGISLYGNSSDRGLAYCNLRLGTARLFSGEIEEAARVVGEGALLATRNRTARLTGEVRAARSRMQPWHNTTAVRELDEQLRMWRIF